MTEKQIEITKNKENKVKIDLVLEGILEEDALENYTLSLPSDLSFLNNQEIEIEVTEDGIEDQDEKD